MIPGQGSVGASGDLAPLAHLAAAMIGRGRYAAAGRGCEPVVLGPKEGLALLNGTQFSTAYALAGLFEAERLLQSALVTGALATDAARGSDTPFDPRIQALRGHRGQIEAAAALRALMAGSAIRQSHLVGDPRVQDPYCLRCQPQVMGAALDVLRQAAGTLEIEANGVSDNPLILLDTGEALSGGNFHAEPVAFAADMIALAVCEIGSLAERRVAMLIDPALSGLAGVPDAAAGAEFGVHAAAGDGGGAGGGEQAAGVPGECRQHPDFGQPGGPCVDGGAWGAAAAADDGEFGRRCRDRVAGGGAGLRLPCAAAVERGAGGGAGRVAPGRAAFG